MFNQEFTVSDNTLREVISKAYRQDETTCVEALLQKAHLSPQQISRIRKQAQQLVVTVRKRRVNSGGLDAFLSQYDLSSEEGIVLMCLAEALLRIPDADTIDRLIKDKITAADWKTHIGKSKSLFVNAATWALMLTGNVLSDSEASERRLSSVLKRLANRGGEPLIRKAVSQSMKIMGRQFVMGRSIDAAIKRAKDYEKKGYLYSYDMLGEAAWTAEDAQVYFDAYSNAIEILGNISSGLGPVHGPGISVKLSALHPRYQYAQRDRVMKELLPKLKMLISLAQEKNIGFTIDAEEADRLDISLDLIQEIIEDPKFENWQGFGFALQAYQKRAIHVIPWIVDLLRKNKKRIMIRLVKGAYWDSEIKTSQELGLLSYPVFTRKVATDVSYIACVKALFQATDVIYPQFATHNAHTLAVVLELAGEHRDFEFQCLHGMGDTLYDEVVGKDNLNIPCRIYAPVGDHESLLAYLVRRLLENGANTSFVNRIVDEHAPIEELTSNPIAKLELYESKPHPQIPIPSKLYGEYRRNSHGLDLSNPVLWKPVLTQMQTALEEEFIAKPTVSNLQSKDEKAIVNASDHKEVVGKVIKADSDIVKQTLDVAENAFISWSCKANDERLAYLERMALLMEQHRATLMALLVREAGKTLPDAIAEVREAIDFCWYYTNQARENLTVPIPLPGPTGELNSLMHYGRGIIACISPWNFPLAIFIGQVVAALAAGNCVIAKPAEQTPLVAAKAIDLLHEAGVPEEVVQLLPGSGREIGDPLLSDKRIAGVLFTGSTATARQINQTLANRDAPIVPLVAETGGQNAMIVDSTALPEQVVRDVIQSAFHSAGQRCSALRVLFLQTDVADKMIAMLKGAMAEIRIGDPMNLSTDVGPVIDNAARDGLLSHLDYLNERAKLIYEVPMNAVLKDKAAFFAPRAYEIDSLDLLKEEVFGPILHIIRYSASNLDEVIDSINQTGYGLTLGIHSRINELVEYISKRVHVGNIYVNRNMVGAVVGVQPFGGEGYSGTGPKAGGPNYLQRLTVERTLTINTTAAGGNATLMSLSES